MRLKHIAATAGMIVLIAGSAFGWADNRFATTLVSSSNLVDPNYGDPTAALGKPTTWIQDPGYFGDVAGAYARSLVCAGCWSAPDGSPLVVKMGSSSATGEVVVAFDQPIVHDATHWYQKDFIVFGNAFYQVAGVLPDSDMETFILGTSLWQVPMTVSVSPDMVNWYTYPAKAGGYWPGNAFAWNKATHSWGTELDSTKPVDPALLQSNFTGKRVSDAIDLYRGSAGGTAFDITESGFQSIKYVKLSGKLAVADAVARVGSPLTIGDAKKLPDGVAVSLGPQIASAGIDELGDCFYIESPDRSSGIKVTGKTISRGGSVTLSGVITTTGGERAIACTWIETGSAASISPVCITNRDVGGGDSFIDPASTSAGQKGVINGSGTNNIGLLVRVCGRVSTLDSALRVFTISDGSGRDIKCSAPAAVTLPALGDYVAATGINSCEVDVSSRLTPLVRLRAADDIKVFQHQ